jgi:hypothetical protein
MSYEVMLVSGIQTAGINRGATNEDEREKAKKKKKDEEKR